MSRNQRGGAVDTSCMHQFTRLDAEVSVITLAIATGLALELVYDEGPPTAS